MYQLEDVYQLNRVTRGDPRVVIAILDGPVDFNHQCLETADLRDLSTECSAVHSSRTAAFHGTHVCSIIFGQGSGGVRGIAPNCRGIVIPIFRDGPTPGTILPCSQVELAVAIDRAVTEGANIVNISGGQLSDSGTVHPILKRVIDRAVAAGVLIVSATGNDACQCHHIPSAYSMVLAVGAHDGNGIALESSNWGEKYRTNGVVALGENVFGAVPGGTRHGSGTSFATPIVSGVAALLMSCQLKSGRPISGAEVQQTIINSAIRCFEPTEACHRQLAGKLNPLAALQMMLEKSQLMTSNIESIQPMIHSNENPQHNNAGQSAEAVSPASQQTGACAIPPGTAPLPVATGQAPKQDHPAPSGPSISHGMPSEITASSAPEVGIQPSDCSCSSKGSLVYVIGEIGFDYGSEARMDSINSHVAAHIASRFAALNAEQQSKSKKSKRSKELKEIPNSPVGQLIDYLEENPYDSGAVIWTISLNNVPIYAVKPAGPYAAEAFERLVEYLNDNYGHDPTKKLCNHVAIPGRIVGSTYLLRTGQTVPVIQPEIRGMSNWNTDTLVSNAVGAEPEQGMVDSLTKILDKIYCEHQNLGVRPQDRAINYAASNTIELTKMIKAARGNKGGRMFFDNIEFEPSAICRPGSECWVVKINFFVHDETEKSRRMFRFTIDVSDLVPVSLGDGKDWYVR